jgi:hypothetical protein
MFFPSLWFTAGCGQGRREGGKEGREEEKDR